MGGVRLCFLVCLFLTFPVFADSPSGRWREREIAWTGISMGGFGALNIALRSPRDASAVAAMCGPFDLALLEAQVAYQLDHFDELPAYPKIKTRLAMLHDLFLALGNPFLEGPSRYRTPEAFHFDLPHSPAGESWILPLNGGSIASDVVSYVDRDNSLFREAGEPIVRNETEPFDDANRNGIYDEDEIYEDSGLDGVPFTRDFGEDDSQFTEDPDRARWRMENPRKLLEAVSTEDLNRLPIYFDCGLEDEYLFFPHAQTFYSALKNAVPAAAYWPSLSSDPRLAHMPRHLFVAFHGEHTGPTRVLFQRLLHVMRFISEQIGHPEYGLDPREKEGELVTRSFSSRSLGTDRNYLLYTPPGYLENSGGRFPLIVFLNGYGTTLKKTQARFSERLFDWAISNHYLRCAFVAIPDPQGTPGTDVLGGNFYLNHIGENGGRFLDGVYEMVEDVLTHFPVAEKSSSRMFAAPRQPERIPVHSPLTDEELAELFGADPE